jgi:hypothetical protein
MKPTLITKRNRVALLTVVATSVAMFGAASANAACSDRPGTPNHVSARAVSATAIELTWNNTASEGFARTPIFGIPYSYELKPRGAIYFDISVREGAPDGRMLGLDRTGYGPFESFGDGTPQTKRWLGTTFAGLKAGRTYCFQLRARTEPGTQGCVSQLASEWACATTPALPLAAATPDILRPRAPVSAAATLPPRPAPRPLMPASTPTPSVYTGGRGSTIAAVATAPIATCLPGYVWRVARPSDLVCVTLQSRARVAEENRTAAARVEPRGGAYGPNTCRVGFVWREAFPGDLVCVTPEVRALVAGENRVAPNRRVQ